MADLQEKISGELLPVILRPGQYIGREIHARYKDLDAAEVSVALAFPEPYRIGISHLGSQILYHMLNDTPAVACDRTYCPEIDAEQVMRKKGIPLFGWESRRALKDFDIVGFSLPYEVCDTNMLTMLDLAGIAIHSCDRSRNDPLIVVGDAMADTPEPIADFVDVFLVGDGEEPLAQFVELVRQAKQNGAGREEILLQAARTIPSAYVPQFYAPHYNDDGTLAAMEPLRDDVPETVQRAHLSELSHSPTITHPLVPLTEAVHERVVIEIMRGCPNGCRFCQAGALRLPVRTRSVQEILDMARAAVASTGFDEIALLSLSSGDYPHLPELIQQLNEQFASRGVSISLPSLRVDQQLRYLPKLASKVRKSGLTIAAEAGSERLRRALRKNITEEDLLAGVRAAYQAGWRRVKVYFMAGLPGETDQDIEAIFALSRKLSQSGKEWLGQPGAISASVSWFVPKPHTPLQWATMRSEEYFFDVRRRLRELTRRSAVHFKFHWIERSLLEGVLCRGDRRLGKAIETAWKNGARMDAWDEHLDITKWQEAFRTCRIDPAFYIHREIPADELTPWSHILGPRSREFLLGEYQRMREILSE